jgi:hypothetical protein
MPFLFACFACVALAQAAATPPSAPEPKASVPPAPEYVSPFAGYRRFDPDAPPKPWRAANDEVRAAGGHVGILKGAASPAPAQKGTAPKDKPPAPHVHGSPR